MTSPDPRALRNAFGTFMTGVTVVTSYNADDNPIGFTANSFTSVSLDPPLVLVCVANTSRNYDALVQAKGFAVNILSENQVEVSNTFARPVEDRFSAVSWDKGPVGSPILRGVTAWFDCTMHKTVDAGDHVILIGRVEGFEQTDAPGLGYACGAYVTPSTTTDALETTTNLAASALIERAGHVLLVDDGNGGLGLPECLVDGEGASSAVNNLIRDVGLHTQPGFIYSVFEDVARKRQHISFLCQSAEGVPTNGAFVPLEKSALVDVSDPAILTMLERLADEAKLGNFGIYYGDQTRGEVRPVVRDQKG